MVLHAICFLSKSNLDMGFFSSLLQDRWLKLTGGTRGGGAVNVEQAISLANQLVPCGKDVIACRLYVNISLCTLDINKHTQTD